MSIKKFEAIPAWHAVLYSALRRTSRRCGYALAIHGSMHRDLDLLAVPWTDEAVGAAELVDAMEKMHGLIPVHDTSKPIKPHGRKSWAYSMGGNYILDLSVMPTDADRRSGGGKGETTR